MTTTAELPPLYQAVLDDAQLDALFADVSQCTRLIEVMAKVAGRAQTPDQSHTLEDARQMLRDGSALGVQLRYIYEGSHWWDTLMRTPTGVRLVRIRHEFEGAASS